MKVAIIEDEMPNMRLLAGMLQSLRPSWELAARLESVRQSVSFFSQEEQPDLVLMDIQLSDGICFSIFEQVKVNSNIIFTTAFNQYAIQAFRVNSVDYLLKPVRESDLERALEKFEMWHRQRHPDLQLLLPGIDYGEILRAIKSGKKEYRQRFLVSAGNRYYKLDTSDIACFMSESRITTAITWSGEKHVVDFSLDRLEEELDPDHYFRADRRTIIHIDLIARFEDYFGNKLVVRLKNPVNDKVTISRLKASAFKVWVGK
ncbi:MAG: LytTR family DNA-binding domain-containing protein [Prolixibacteraceae bacterium]|jgi:DNA-binding LytR/AlgR family response regulator|nr:response regulator transcription factor [Prolixibacteraceae bacterium]MDI9564727.1 LytTR family DNA-binding domain-containing protein [Bacteroidota bacterium]NLS99616.1 response regulator transcription factor [Bacteroidales bacterium]OQB78530.1 MAG: Transcriptional regulatory protein YpdB [Bacteroidetes bacterium ADurb.Bin123]HNU77242.1 LytTR family DNA-binding domain-containing protein [Prolixibacteraceae bacterium]